VRLPVDFHEPVRKIHFVRNVQDFMREFFRDGIVEEQRFQASREPLRRKFYASDCRYDSHCETLKRLESEEVVSVDMGESEAKVITEQKFRYSGGVKTVRLRYQLQPVKNDWLIREVQRACLV